MAIPNNAQMTIIIRILDIYQKGTEKLSKTRVHSNFWLRFQREISFSLNFSVQIAFILDGRFKKLGMVEKQFTNFLNEYFRISIQKLNTGSCQGKSFATKNKTITLISIGKINSTWTWWVDLGWPNIKWVGVGESLN